ncbi:hypothetical protein AB0L05_32860 [Nonomuraea pusilla]|uniref:hypothetical protein n=1 Tax=Nonomuraea pusilla TaxID=46177 RepID=UPI003333B8B2
MRDEQYTRQLIEVSALPLHDGLKMESAALRAAAMSCLADDNEYMAGFSNTI